jgi:hypothetical protein
MVVDGRIVVETRGKKEDLGPLRDDAPATSQVAGALAAYTLHELQPPVAAEATSQPKVRQ